MEHQKKLNLSESYLRLEAVIQTATDGIIIIDERGIMEMANDAATKLFDYDLPDMIGQNVNMLMPSPHRAQHDGYLANYLHTGHRKIIGIGREVQGRRKDGHLFPCRLSISEVVLKNRRVFTGIIHDLTEQKEAERALREEKEKAQTYFDLANTINVVLDTQTRILELNNKGCAFINQKEDAVRGIPWFDLVLPLNNRQPIQLAFRQMMEGTIPLADSFEVTVIDHQGKPREYAWKNNFLTEGERITGMICSGIDITEQRLAEARIRNMNAELEQRVEQRTEELAHAINQLLNINKKLEYEIQERKAAEEALRNSERELRRAYEAEKELSELKSRFVSMASHEFRTPLSAVLSSADLIEAYEREDQHPKRLRHTQRIKSAVTTLTGILNDFLSLSKLEEGKVACEPVEFAIEPFCQEVMEELQGLLKEGQLLNHQGLPPGQLVCLDKKLLKNILYNLLSNAIKYSNEGQVIDCLVEINKNTELAIHITDHGIGIPQEDQKHLFTRFFRAHNVENIQGTGLGLNIVKRYVDLMDGNITFVSDLGKGTTFTVNIPIKELT